MFDKASIEKRAISGKIAATRTLFTTIAIIVEKDRMLIFTDVKTKKFGDFGDSVKWIKRSKLLQSGRVARGYLYEKNITYRECRFDVVLVNWEDGLWKIDHHENVI